MTTVEEVYQWYTPLCYGSCYRKLQTNAENTHKAQASKPQDLPTSLLPPSSPFLPHSPLLPPFPLLLPHSQLLPPFPSPPPTPPFLPPLPSHSCFCKVLNPIRVGGILLNCMAHLSCLLNVSKVFLPGINLSLTTNCITKVKTLGIWLSHISLAKFHHCYTVASFPLWPLSDAKQAFMNTKYHIPKFNHLLNEKLF